MRIIVNVAVQRNNKKLMAYVEKVLKKKKTIDKTKLKIISKNLIFR